MTAGGIEVSEEAGVRSLHFGSSLIQGAMRIARPYALELEYTREMMLCLLLRGGPAWPRNALLIGLGAASLTKFLYRHRPGTRITVVEIDPRMETIAAQYFKLPDDPRRLAIEIADGVDYIAGARTQFDLILVDGFDAKARAGGLEVLPFYAQCRPRLTEKGLLGVNLLDRHRGFATRLGWLREAFDDRVLALPPCASGNTVAFAATGETVGLTHDELADAARSLRSSTGLNLLPTIARMGRAGVGERGRLAL
jgi:spermidine synthase